MDSRVGAVGAAPGRVGLEPDVQGGCSCSRHRGAAATGAVAAVLLLLLTPPPLSVRGEPVRVSACPPCLPMQTLPLPHVTTLSLWTPTG